MPMYAFRCGKRLVTRSFPVSERPKSIEIDGRVYKRSYADERPGVPATAGWPIECYASGVNPDQAGELRDYLAKKGVPTEVSADGNPIYRDASHRRKALKARGLHDRASYF
jgi:hypothetical protein